MVFLYTLHDSARPEEIRYVGISRNTQRRLRRHRLNSKRRNYHAANWWRSLAENGREPILVVRAIVESDEIAQQIEKQYIKKLRELGHDLTNGTAGGEGTEGRSPWNKGLRGACSPETLQRMSAGKVGTSGWPKGKLRGSCWNKGGETSEETRAKQRASARRRFLDPAERIKAGNGFRGKIHSPEARAKIAAASTGRSHTVKARDKMRRAWTIRREGEK